MLKTNRTDAMKDPIGCSDVRADPAGGYECPMHHSCMIEDARAAGNMEERTRSLHNESSETPVR